MTKSLFKHAGCGGNIYVDISKAFEWPTPSLTITPEGISVGVTEFRVKRQSKKSGPVLRCDTCEEEWLLQEAVEHVEADCQICGDTKPIAQMGNNRQVQCACKSCQDVIMGVKSPENERQRRVMEFIFFGNTKSISFVSFADILSKPIRF